MEYKHNLNSVFLVTYHIVFCPKYRRQLLLGDIKKKCEEIFNDVARDNGWEIISMEIMPDHVHLFIGADPLTKPHIVVKKFKGRTSRILRQEFPELLKMPTLWTHAYFLSTAGNVAAPIIKKYIEQQWEKI